VECESAANSLRSARNNRTGIPRNQNDAQSMRSDRALRAGTMGCGRPSCPLGWMASASTTEQCPAGNVRECVVTRSVLEFPHYYLVLLR
jgi:hypothetical protein